MEIMNKFQLSVFVSFNLIRTYRNNLFEICSILISFMIFSCVNALFFITFNHQKRSNAIVKVKKIFPYWSVVSSKVDDDESAQTPPNDLSSVIAHFADRHDVQIATHRTTSSERHRSRRSASSSDGSSRRR